MVAFNEINGIPATGTRQFVRTMLREELGFDGVIVSDWGSVYEMLKHRSAVYLPEATSHAITAGVDIDMESRGYVRHLADLVRHGVVSESSVDDAVRRVLTAKFPTGIVRRPLSGY